MNKMKTSLLVVIAMLLGGILVLLALPYFSEEEEKASTVQSTEGISDNTAEEPAKQPADENVVNDLGSEEAIAAENGEEDKAEQPADEKDTAASLEKELMKQDLVIEDYEYIVQDDEHKALYPDMLSAITTNNSKQDIKNIRYAFVAWDENGLPIRLKGSIDFSDGAYLYEIKGDAVNIAPGESFGRDSGFEIDEYLDEVASFKAIVTGYDGFDGKTWENPLFDDFRKVYEGERLKDIKGYEKYVYQRFVSNKQESSDSSMDVSYEEQEVTEFIENYFTALEDAYAAQNPSLVEKYLIAGTQTHDTLEQNISNNAFPNLKIWSSDIVHFDKEANEIYIEVYTERTNDNLNEMTGFTTGYEIKYIPADDRFEIQSYTDL